jgi:hypothetical protein
MVEYIGSKEDPLIQAVRTHHHSINSALLQAARRLKTIIERNKTNNGQHSRENKRKMARE